MTFSQWLTQLQVALPVALFALLVAISVWTQMREVSETALISTYSLSNAQSVNELRFNNTLLRNELAVLRSVQSFELRSVQIGVDKVYQRPLDTTGIEYTSVVLPEPVGVELVDEEVINNVPDTIQETLYLWIRNSLTGNSAVEVPVK